MSIHPTKNSEENIYINAWNMIPGIGAHKLFTIAQNCDSFASAWHMDTDELAKIGLNEKTLESISAARSKINPHIAWQILIQQNTSLITFDHADYPYNLSLISNPPFCLYVRGAVDCLSKHAVAIVGARKISEYGKRATITFASDMARNGITVISGLALGTDAIAHRTTLDHGGATIAILAGGIDDATIAPHSHISLAHDILRNGGAIISEYPPMTQPHRGTFPARNRLMAALADATIIIEAAEKSGTLITAQHARTYHKKIFALPGSIFAENAVGPNCLIRDGYASPLLTSEDILATFAIQKPLLIKKDIVFSDPTQHMLYDLIKKHEEGIQINHLIKESSLSATIVSGVLTILEIDGHIKNIGNQTYIGL